MPDESPASFLDSEVPDGWDCLALDDLVDADRGISYGIVQPGKHDPSGVPIVRVNNLRNGRIETDDVLRVSAAIEETHSRTRLRGGEVLLSLVGTLGECAVVPPELKGWNVARAVAVIPIRDDFDSRWITTCLRSAPVQHLICSWATTTVQATFNLRDVRRLPIVIPPSETRKWMTQVLGLLDNKIELNRRMNGLLEGIARAIFQAWFVDFEPIKAKAAGAASFPGMSQPVFDQLTSAFIESELGEIPEGWQVESLDKTANFLNGSALQKYPPRDGEKTLPVIKIAQLRRGNSEGADQCNTDVPPQYVVVDGDVLFSWSGSLECVLWTGGRGALNQHLFKVSSDDFPKWFYYLWVHYHLPHFRHVAASKATTMGHIQRRHLADAKVVVPSEPVRKAAHTLLAPTIDQIIKLKLESRILAGIRDTLLPKLISGDIAAPASGGSND